MNFPKLFAVICGLLLLTGCIGPALLSLTTPITGYTLHSDIAYGDDPRQQLDMYVPDTVDASRSVVVFFHGGSWQHGDKKDYRFVGQAFAAQGFVTVIADYRLYPQVRFPDFVQDGADAVGWVHNHIPEYGGNPRNVFLAGHSAGAYIAAMLGVNDTYLKEAGGNRGWVRGVIGLAGPYDFLPMTDPAIIDIFSTAKGVDTQPITFASSASPPMLLAAGDHDTQVQLGNTLHMSEKLRQSHVSVTENIYPDVAHTGIILALANGFHFKAPVLQDAVDFIHANAATGTAPLSSPVHALAQPIH